MTTVGQLSEKLVMINIQMLLLEKQVDKDGLEENQEFFEKI
jgi:hypothetical protein